MNDISQEIKINEFIDNVTEIQQFSEKEKSELKSYLVEILPNEELDKLNSAFK